MVQFVYIYHVIINKLVGRIKVGRKYFLYTDEEINLIRSDFWLLFQKFPLSFREYSRKMGLAPSGQVLSDFAYDRRPATARTICSVKNYLSERKFS